MITCLFLNTNSFIHGCVQNSPIAFYHIFFKTISENNQNQLWQWTRTFIMKLTSYNYQNSVLMLVGTVLIINLSFSLHISGSSRRRLSVSELDVTLAFNYY